MSLIIRTNKVRWHFMKNKIILILNIFISLTLGSTLGRQPTSLILNTFILEKIQLTINKIN